jgi:serine/threonine protein kinase/cytochrome c-type biogenesis protein CcmH/NrfG
MAACGITSRPLKLAVRAAVGIFLKLVGCFAPQFRIVSGDTGILMTDQAKTEEAIFLAARQLATAELRMAYIQQACADDENLRQRLMELLAANDASQGPLDLPPPGIKNAATIDQPAFERLGTLIGPYKLLQQIGEGGMGVVYMAEQEQPLRRRVALKIIKPGMDSRQVIARFEAERQALSLMDHPNIAKVVDAGTTEGGRPYFVMELVKGQPITQYCDEKHLTPRQRLELLLPVCQAIQHAHQKGIIHRDIKPSNILVAEYDEKPVPKVIDFGVAKAIGSPLTEKTMFTGFGQIIGTLEYMSPEQAKVNQLDIDTRSDIYSLGVLLYELLAGSTPFDTQRLRSAAFDEMLRIIREEEPPRPSTKLSSSESLPSVAANRSMEPARLSKTIRGELDWIVMKALEKDRNRRYESANGLSMDIQRYLGDEPVLACPPSAAYRLRKFARRNRRLLFASVLLALAATAIVGSIGWALGDRLERRAAADRGAAAALDEAHEALDAGRRAAGRTALDRADSYLVAAGDRQVALRAKGLRRDLELLERLDKVRVESLDRSDHDIKLLNFARTESEYAEAFGTAGIALDGADARESAYSQQQIAEQFAGRVGKAELAGALDDWAAARRAMKNDAGAKRLLAVARLIDPASWRNRVRDAVDLGDVAALKTLADSPELTSQSASSLHCLAKALVDMKAIPEAVAVLTAAHPRHVGDFWMNYTLGHALTGYRKSGRDPTPYFMAAAALRPNDDAASLHVAFQLGQQKNPAARGWLDLVAQQHPTSASMHEMRGQILRNLGDQTAAMAAWREALRLQPDNQESRLSLARNLVTTGAYEEAVEMFDEYIRRIPPDAPDREMATNTTCSQLLRIAELLTTGADPNSRNPQVAVRAASRVVEINPQYVNANALLGMAQYRAGEYAAAREVFSRRIAQVQRPYEVRFYNLMAQTKLGNAVDPQKKFATAVLLAEKNLASDESVRRLAAEAADVVGATVPPSFRDGPQSPVLAPLPVSPANWSLLDRSLIDSKQGRWFAKLNWEPVKDATNYHIQLRKLTFPSIDPSLANPISATLADNSQVRGTTWPCGSQVATRRPGEPIPQVCLWRVRAFVDDAWTAWCPEQALWVTPLEIAAPKLKN